MTPLPPRSFGSTSAPRFSAIHLTFPSFSYLLNVQVEYTSTPSLRKDGHTSASILLWRPSHKATLSSDHCCCACSSFLNMPSPEHGTSATMISKYPVSEANARGSSHVTTTLGSPHKATLSARTPTRAFMTSFATSMKLSPHAWRTDAAISVVFPPGAAHKSSTLNGRDVGMSIRARISLKRWPTNIDDESCT